MSSKRDLELDAVEQNARRRKTKTQKDHDDCGGPVLELKLDYGDAGNSSSPPPSISLSPTLDDMLGGVLSPDDFLRNDFAKRAVHVSAADSEQHAEIHEMTRVAQVVQAMHYLDPEAILRETSSDNIFLWLLEREPSLEKFSPSNGNTTTNKNDNNNDTPLIQSIEVDNAETALALFKAGHATYCRAPPEVEQNLVASLLRATGLGCGQYDPSGDDSLTLGRGEVETFMSHRGHITSWHFDFQQNFTIQLSGTKRWTLQEGTIRFPLRGCTPHYAELGAVESQLKAHYLFDRKFVFGNPTVPLNAKGAPKSVILHAGDVLFFPAGMWHKVETVEDSVSINVSLMATNYAQAVSQAMYHYLYRDARFREPIVNNSQTSAVDHLRQLMRDLPQMVAELSKQDGEGADDILPPALRFPPTYEHVEDGDDDDDELVDDDDEINDDDEAMEEEEQRTESEAAQQEINEDDRPSGANDDNDEVVDPSEFIDYPEEWDFKLEIGSTVELYKNPLSALHKRHEIIDYYNKKAPIVSRAREAFVLNVNYGGNEMHGSAIRVVFWDSLEQFTEILWRKEREMATTVNEPLFVCQVTVSNHYLISFLVYHGYLQAKPIQT